MSFIDIPASRVEEAQEPKAVPEGEYELSVLRAEVKDTRTGGKMISLAFKIEGEPLAQVVPDWLHLPDDNDDPNAENRKLLRIKQFCQAFDYDYANGIDTDELVGQTGKAILGLKEHETYGEQNSIRKYV